MTYDLSKVFAFLSLKPSLHKKRVKRRLHSIACVRDVLLDPSKRFYVNGRLKHNAGEHLRPEYTNTTESREKKTHLVKTGRSMSVSGTVTDRESRFCFHSTTAEHSNKKGQACKVTNESFVNREHKREDEQEIWRLFRDISINNETSIQGGLLTTTLCSTEL